jgi:sulfur-oxidizing protein SoxA
LKGFLFIVCLSLWGNSLAQEARRSGYDFMSRETQALQDDDAANPGMLWVLDGESLWSAGCAACHKAGMKGVAARYPALYKGKLVNLEQRINLCRVEQQKLPPLAYESKDLLALTAYIGRQSRGLPIDVQNSSYVEAGKQIFFRRQGQLNLACYQCHDQQAGKRLAGNAIPQAHPTGYPIYRLEWQGLGSLQRRLRNCLSGIRAEPYPYGAQELVELELYLMWRARGMKIETPAVRP